MMATVVHLAAAILLLVLAGPSAGRRFHTRGEPGAQTSSAARPVEFHMPPYQPKENDAYVCTGVKVSDLVGTDATVWVTQYRALSDADTAHHMLLFQCDSISKDQKAAGKWECGHHGVCQNSQVMYAWAKNAPATKLPDDVGFKIGGDTKHKYLVLQIHYAHPLPAPDTSGVELMVSERTQKYQAGIYLLLDGSVVIPPNTPATHADVNCQYQGLQKLTAFAYRVHAHKLGKVITGYRYNTKNQTLVEMARGNPQWPQAFYPMKYPIDIHPGDLVHARCTFDSTGRNRTTYIGATSADEMCNLYVMYYTDALSGRSAFACVGENVPQLTDALPANSDQPLPPNPLLEEHAKHTHKEDMSKTLHYHVSPSGAGSSASGDALSGRQQDGQQQQKQQQEQEQQPVGTVVNPDDYEPGRVAKTLGGVKFVAGWGGSDHTFGQAVAVSVDLAGNVVVFHRASRQWTGASFVGDKLRDTSTPIPENTIVYVKNDTGEMVLQTGARFFHMPHGLTVDDKDNVWCTDVGMHQVFKFGPRLGNGTPLMTLGTKFEPGSDDFHFCKPTSVAVMRDGSFFVADGYCNTRILKFGPGGGRPVRSVGRASSSLLGLPPALDEFNIPHSLTLLEDRNMVCTADRENGRVVCFRASDLSTTDLSVTWQRSRIFGLAFSPREGGALFVVNGPNFAKNKVQGYVVSVNSKSVISTFSPDGNGLSNPHDVAVSHDGTAVYVVELSPRKLWKFNVDGPHSAQKKNLQTGSAPSAEFVKSADAASSDSQDPALSGTAKLVMAALFAVPLVVFGVIMVVIRLRRRGQRRRFFLHNLNDGGAHRKTLDSLLGNKSRQGFEPLATQDLDEDSDSDVEEFIAKIKSRT